MEPITKEQRRAIKRIYDRGPIFDNDDNAQKRVLDNGWCFTQDPDHGWIWCHPTHRCVFRDAADVVEYYGYGRRLTYRQFRKTVQQGYDCLMVRWKGMTLGIEKDGYVHS